MGSLYISAGADLEKDLFALGFRTDCSHSVPGSIDTALYGSPSSLSELGGPWESAQMLLMFWPGVAGTVKRLHDLEINAKHVAGMYGVWALAITLFLFNRTGSDLVTPGLLAALVTAVLAIIYTLYLLIPCCFKQGVQGAYSYGPDPLDE